MPWLFYFSHIISYFTSWFVNSSKNRYHRLHCFTQLQRLVGNWLYQYMLKERGKEGRKKEKEDKRNIGKKKNHYSSPCTAIPKFLTLDVVAVASTQV